MGAGSGHSFLGRHTSLVCLAWAIGYMTDPSSSCLTQIPIDLWWWWGISGPLRDSSALPVDVGEHPAQQGAQTPVVTRATPGQHSQFLFRKEKQPAKIKGDIPRNLWTQMSVFLELRIQDRKEEKARSVARCHGVCSLARGQLLPERQEAWVAGDPPGGALA